MLSSLAEDFKLSSSQPENGAKCAFQVNGAEKQISLRFLKEVIDIPLDNCDMLIART